MNDQVLVTLCFGQTERDYALPLSTPLAELYPRLLAVLQNSDSNMFRRATAICLQREDGYLADKNAALLDYGVKNGSRLTVCVEG